jgi:transposase
VSVRQPGSTTFGNLSASYKTSNKVSMLDEYYHIPILNANWAYNKHGSAGLGRKGRGGRRWSLISWEEEAALLKSLENRAVEGQLLTAKQLLPEVSQSVGHEVSLGYVYALLRRHRWRKLGPRPRHVKAKREIQEEFKKNYQASSAKK